MAIEQAKGMLMGRVQEFTRIRRPSVATEDNGATRPRCPCSSPGPPAQHAPTARPGTAPPQPPRRLHDQGGQQRQAATEQEGVQRAPLERLAAQIAQPGRIRRPQGRTNRVGSGKPGQGNRTIPAVKVVAVLPQG
jgi:hypothetical protein